MSKKVIIIGAGIAGLSAGCYLRMNGCDTEIFELHTGPGGLCTSWERGGYIFDGCIHILAGSNPSGGLYHIWNELVDMKSLTFVDYSEYLRVEDKNGQSISVRSDLDELEQELLEKAPEDKKLIKELIEAARKSLLLEQTSVEKEPETVNRLEKDLEKWKRMTTAEFAKKCKNPLLEKAFTSMSPPEMSASFLILLLVCMHNKDAGYPIGGSLNFARLIEKKYLELGGNIHYKSRVKKIITKDNAAKGVMLENDEIYSSDMVVSAADGHSTIFEMLEGKYTDKEILHTYENYKTTPPYFQVSLGVSRTFPGVSNLLVFLLEKELVIDPGTSCEDIGVKVYNFDPTMAPEGKTVITAGFSTNNYKYWVDLRENNREKYKEEKKRIADEVIDILEKKFGNMKSHIEVIDVSTPATVIRYTNNWKGSPLGWLLTPEASKEPMKKVLPGLTDFYMVGHWVEPCGGLPGAMISGRSITQVICEEDKKEFTTSNY